MKNILAPSAAAFHTSLSFGLASVVEPNFDWLHAGAKNKSSSSASACTFQVELWSAFSGGSIIVVSAAASTARPGSCEAASSERVVPKHVEIVGRDRWHPLGAHL